MARRPTRSEAAIINDAAAKAGISPAVLWGVYGAESSFGANPGRSTAGALGPFQFIMSTARGMGLNEQTVHQFKPAAYAAAKYLAQYKSRGVQGMLCAYNAGPNGSCGNSETSAYIPRVLNYAKSWPGGTGAKPTRTTGSGRGGTGSRTVTTEGQPEVLLNPTRRVRVGTEYVDLPDLYKTSVKDPKYNKGGFKIDFGGAILDSLLDRKHGGRLMKRVMSRVDSGRYTTYIKPSVTPGKLSRTLVQKGGEVEVPGKIETSTEYEPFLIDGKPQRTTVRGSGGKAPATGGRYNTHGHKLRKLDGTWAVPWTAGGSRTPEGKPIMVEYKLLPALNYALMHGWDGKLNDGIRSVAEQSRLYYGAPGNGLVRGVTVAAPGQSQHQAGRGALDVANWQQFRSIMAGYKGPNRLRWAGISGDEVHFSLTGH